MKKAVFFGLTALLAAAVIIPLSPAIAGEAENEPAEGQARVEIAVTGMTCGDCCVKVETALKELEGIVDSSADYEAGVATVTYVEDEVSVESIVETINEKTSFKASMPEKKS